MENENVSQSSLNTITSNETESTADDSSLKRITTFNNEKYFEPFGGDDNEMNNAGMKKLNVDDDYILNSEAVKRSWNVMTNYISKVKKRIKIMQQRNRRLKRNALLHKNILMYYRQKYLLPEHLALRLSNCELELDRTQYLN